MPNGDEGSVTSWIGHLKDGDSDAAQRLWERYFERMVRPAGAKLRAVHHAAAVEDEEDAALSAFESFFDGVRRGSFPRLTDRDDLWRLLVLITARKAWDQVERRRAKKRGGKSLEGGWASELEEVIGKEPTP